LRGGNAFPFPLPTSLGDFETLLQMQLISRFLVIPGFAEIIPGSVDKNSRLFGYGNFCAAVQSENRKSKKFPVIFPVNGNFAAAQSFARAAAPRPARRPKTAPDIRPVPLA
jgi:hypothetical protein